MTDIKAITPYERKAFYYETDQMGVIHHSNYIRWFEEARVDFLEKAGFSYKRMEDMGVMIPVLGASCEYKNAVRFSDTVIIVPKIKEFNGFKMTVTYRVIRKRTTCLWLSAKQSTAFQTRRCGLSGQKRTTLKYLRCLTVLLVLTFIDAFALL